MWAESVECVQNIRGSGSVNEGDFLGGLFGPLIGGHLQAIES